MVNTSVCGHCGSIHGGMCPRVKSIEYHENGLTTKKIEYHPPADPISNFAKWLEENNFKDACNTFKMFFKLDKP